MEAKEREEDDGGADGLPEVRGLIGVWGSEFGHQDAEYVHEEACVRQDAQQAWRWVNKSKDDGKMSSNKSD